MLCPRAPQRGEKRRKKETTLTKISLKAQKEGRAPLLGQKKVWPSQIRETVFLNEICIITNQYKLFSDTACFVSYRIATGKDIYVENYLLSPS